MNELQRTLDEIILLYQLEPNTKDIFVEGISDKLILERFIEKNGLDDIKVLQVHEINFSSLYTQNPKIKSNNRAKLIELNTLLESNFSEKLIGISIIIDRDFDEVLNRLPLGRYLYVTDYNSLELYLFNPHTLDIFYKNIIRSFPINGAETIRLLTPILIDNFFVRLALKKDGHIPDDKFTPFNKTFLIDKSKLKVTFDPHKHIQKVLNNVRKTSELQDFIYHFNEAKEKASFGHKNIIRGHDFIALLYELINKVNNSIGLTIDTLERSMFQCIDYSKLKTEPLFSNLLKKYQV
ncbi:hypothetical protein FPZ43_16720 [Mucilaginibacter pallidiroseus]|uniref:DUF4435 domain-containing protein n=1 Tax=Mucilaginibacter pallidiroseus TaxID=2599295 RepID=A0A563U0G0_9SPHI|nr:hypothetical protein [Mucilaginibacter pallidiroseus]TWR25118.1 hypothetical protein FPZ43_16720 [Mucilaginibacter pallidiroseus]